MVSERIKWIIKKLPRKKLSIAVFGAPEGHELIALKKRAKKLTVYLTETKAKIPGVHYAPGFMVAENYDRVIILTLNIARIFHDFPLYNALKEDSELFIVCPAGNGSTDWARTGFTLSARPAMLEKLTPLPVTARYFRSGALIERDRARKMKALEGKEVVQFATLHFAPEKEV